MFCVTDMHKQVSGFLDSVDAHAKTVAPRLSFSPLPLIKKKQRLGTRLGIRLIHVSLVLGGLVEAPSGDHPVSHVGGVWQAVGWTQAE